MAQQFLGEGHSATPGGMLYSFFKETRRFCFETSQGPRGTWDLRSGRRPGSCRLYAPAAAPDALPAGPAGELCGQQPSPLTGTTDGDDQNLTLGRRHGREAALTPSEAAWGTGVRSGSADPELPSISGCRLGACPVDSSTNLPCRRAPTCRISFMC